MQRFSLGCSGRWLSAARRGAGPAAATPLAFKRFKRDKSSHPSSTSLLSIMMCKFKSGSYHYAHAFSNFCARPARMSAHFYLSSRWPIRFENLKCIQYLQVCRSFRLGQRHDTKHMKAIYGGKNWLARFLNQESWPKLASLLHSQGVLKESRGATIQAIATRVQ